MRREEEEEEELPIDIELRRRRAENDRQVFLHHNSEGLGQEDKYLLVWRPKRDRFRG